MQRRCQDTLSLARLGASVTGVDISDEAIAFACRLSAESGIPATFHRADLYDWLDDAVQRGETFDIVFSSYGFLFARLKEMPGSPQDCGDDGRIIKYVASKFE
jgi:hypothetical protein